MDDGSRATIYDLRPCARCGGRVRLLSGICDRCKAKHLRPQAGPQTQFLSCPADLVLTGGGAGSGKSISLLMDAACYAHVPKWNGVIFRANKKDITGPAGIFNKAKKLYAGMPGLRDREGGAYIDLRWPSGAILEFRHLDGQNVFDYQGLEYAWIGIDEATHFDMRWIRYLITRMRTDSGVKCLMRMTCNPDPDHELREWVDWYLHPDGTSDRDKNGVIRYWAVSPETDRLVWGGTAEECASLSGRPINEVKSFSYVSALVELDNPILLAENPDYVANLAQSGRVNEERLRKGNWNVREETGGMLRRSRWGEVDEPLAQIYKAVRAWDKASTRPHSGNTDPDYTAGVRMEWDMLGRFYITDVVACRDEPAEVAALQRTTAEADGPSVTQLAKRGVGDTGKSDFLHTRIALKAGGARVIPVPEQASKVVRAQPLSDALAQGMGKDIDGRVIPRGFVLNRGDWLRRPYKDAGGNAPPTMGQLFWQQVTKFFDGKAHDDIPDAMADAFNELARQEPEQENPLERFRRLR